MDFFVRQLQHALQDGIRPGFLLIESLVTWDEETGDHSRRIGRNADGMAAKESRLSGGSSEDAAKTPGVLHGREESERRLGSLVEIGARSLQAVKASTGLWVPHEDLAVIVTEEPIASQT